MIWISDVGRCRAASARTSWRSRHDDSTCLHTPMAKTLRKVEWRSDARVLGSFPFTHWGLWVPFPFVRNLRW